MKFLAFILATATLFSGALTSSVQVEFPEKFERDIEARAASQSVASHLNPYVVAVSHLPSETFVYSHIGIFISDRRIKSISTPAGIKTWCSEICLLTLTFFTGNDSRGSTWSVSRIENAAQGSFNPYVQGKQVGPSFTLTTLSLHYSFQFRK